ncbi:unnamed protein product [Gongylonema pulchrum]|uniref:Transcriptional regulator n=1 Tax=Gongylonema pulchrum TaxID=637853 RepID=A0A183E2M5_9BILA|nr:unnamed protein product [Gongylonema pulchrum]
MKDYSKRMFTALKIAQDVLRTSLASVLHSDQFEIVGLSFTGNRSSPSTVAEKAQICTGSVNWHL